MPVDRSMRLPDKHHHEHSGAPDDHGPEQDLELREAALPVAAADGAPPFGKERRAAKAAPARKRARQTATASHAEATFVTPTGTTLVGAGLIKRLSMHDTDPAKNIPVPRRYRS